MATPERRHVPVSTLKIKTQVPDDETAQERRDHAMSAAPRASLSLGASANTKPDQEKKPHPRKLVSALAAVAMVGGLAGGGLLIHDGMQPKHNVEQVMPLPVQDTEISISQAMQAAGPVNETATVKQTAHKGTVNEWDGEMSAVKMKPMSVWIPTLGSRANIVPTSGFEPSKYSGLQTLQIPASPRVAGWYTGGGALAGENEGTTLLASHISMRRSVRGAFYDISKLQGGDMVWTADGDGNKQAWAVTKVWHTGHKNFPEEYFASDGERRLVLTTCGGRINRYGYYRENIFVVATPIPAQTV